MDLRQPDGTRWGVLSAPDPEALAKNLADRQDFDRRYCRWLGKEEGCTPHEHSNPSAPRCSQEQPDEDLCGPGAAERIAALERKVADATSRLARSSASAELVRQGAASVSSANPFGNVGRTLQGYGRTLQDASTKLRALRDALASCVKTGPVAEAEQVFWIGGAYGVTGHERQQRSGGSLRELEEDFAVPLPILEFPEVEIPDHNVTVRPKLDSPRGHLLIGSSAAKEGPHTRAGRTPIAFAYQADDGGWHVTQAEITDRAPTPDGHGQILTLCGKAGGLHEMWILTIGPSDRDRDGFFDYQDRCPDVKGTDGGCPPDADRDGVADESDRCPSLAGLRELGGCPSDRDRDGIYDASDACPDAAGPANTRGCPPDSDGDGIADANDGCPSLRGIASNGGCPEGYLRNHGDCEQFLAAWGGRQGQSFSLGPSTTFYESCQEKHPQLNVVCRVFEAHDTFWNPRNPAVHSKDVAGIPNLKSCFGTPWWSTSIPETYWACCVTR